MKTRYFTEVENNEIEKSFEVPLSTLKGWKKKRNDGEEWRGGHFDKLSLYVSMEKQVLENLNQIFNKKEWQALWECLKSTMITKDLLFMKEMLSYRFVDYCAYEEMEAGQFTDDLEKFSKIVSEKLAALSPFEKYVLLEHISDPESGIFKED